MLTQPYCSWCQSWLTGNQALHSLAMPLAAPGVEVQFQLKKCLRCFSILKICTYSWHKKQAGKPSISDASKTDVKGQFWKLETQLLSDSLGLSGAQSCVCHMVLCHTGVEVTSCKRKISFQHCIMFYGNVTLSVYLVLCSKLFYLCYVVSRNIALLSSTKKRSSLWHCIQFKGIKKKKNKTLKKSLKDFKKSVKKDNGETFIVIVFSKR